MAPTLAIPEMSSTIIGERLHHHCRRNQRDDFRVELVLRLEQVNLHHVWVHFKKRRQVLNQNLSHWKGSLYAAVDDSVAVKAPKLNRNQ
jgi:hypothetical protein